MRTFRCHIHDNNAHLFRIGNYRIFQESTTAWCPEREEHGYYLTPAFKCSTNPRVTTAHRWTAVDLSAKLDKPTGRSYSVCLVVDLTRLSGRMLLQQGRPLVLRRDLPVFPPRRPLPAGVGVPVSRGKSRYPSCADFLMLSWVIGNLLPDISSVDQRDASWAQEHLSAEHLRDRTAILGRRAQDSLHRPPVHRLQRCPLPWATRARRALHPNWQVAGGRIRRNRRRRIGLGLWRCLERQRQRGRTISWWHGSNL